MQFSIIIPTYNRPQRLRECLVSLVYLDPDSVPFEVVLVFDGGSMPAEAIIAEFEAQLTIRTMRQENMGVAYARNAGAAAAVGEYLIFLDDDYRVAPDWLNQFTQQFAQSPDAMVGGDARNFLNDNIYSTASQVLNEIVYIHYNADHLNARFHSGGNMGMKRSLFSELGGNDPLYIGEIIGEDRDLCERWLRRGWQIVYNPKIVIYHAHSLTLRSFWQQHYGYAYGAYTFRKQVLATSEEGDYPIEWRLHWLIWTYGLRFIRRLGFWRAVRVQLLLYIQQLATVVGTFVGRWHYDGTALKNTSEIEN